MSREGTKRGTLPPAVEHIEKLKKVASDGDYYGAQQMYKSISARYIAAQRYSEALDILESGACIQLKHEQVTCGAELALLFVQALVRGRVSFDDVTLDRVRKIHMHFPRIPLPHQLGDDVDMQRLSETFDAAKTYVEGGSSFLKAAIRWSAEFGADRKGSPEMHTMLAEYIYSESPELDIAKVSFHFVRGNKPEKFASTLVHFMGKCYPGEDDLSIARAVLMYLSLGNLRDANFIVDEIKKQVKSKEIDFPQSELIQFINYLMQALQRAALPLFNMLRQIYKSSIDREPAFNELLDVIGEKFYGVKRKKPVEVQGMLGDLFKMLEST